MLKAPAEIGLWEICIGGKKVPALTKDDLARVQAKQEGTWESRFNNARVQAQQQNIIRKEYYQQAYLWFRDMELIDERRTFKYATMQKKKRGQAPPAGMLSDWWLDH